MVSEYACPKCGAKIKAHLVVAHGVREHGLKIIVSQVLMALPTIDFQQLLGSLRADGKLVLTTLIKAAGGKKFVVDARDTPNALDFDLEDENGIVETVSIPKGSAVDATARAAAAAAQEDIDDHEADHPEGGGGGETTPLSDDTPEATGDADAGVGTDASRDDHVHNVPNATTTTTGHFRESHWGRGDDRRLITKHT